MTADEKDSELLDATEEALECEVTEEHDRRVALAAMRAARADERERCDARYKPLADAVETFLHPSRTGCSLEELRASVVLLSHTQPDENAAKDTLALIDELAAIRARGSQPEGREPQGEDK